MVRVVYSQTDKLQVKLYKGIKTIYGTNVTAALTFLQPSEVSAQVPSNLRSSVPIPLYSRNVLAYTMCIQMSFNNV